MKKVAIATFFIFMLCPFLAGQSWQGRLWKITGNELSRPSWVYGTFHIPDPRVFVFPDSLEFALHQVDMAGFEIDFSGLNPFELAQMLKADTALSTFFPARVYRKMEQRFANRTGLRLSDFEGIKPIFTLSQLMERPAPGDSSIALDLALQNRARLLGLKIIGLETIQEQMAALETMPEEMQAEELRKELLEKKVDSDLETMINLYTTGDLDSLYSLGMESMTPGSSVDSALLIIRNIRMAERMHTWMQSGNVVFFIGALHLPGPEGVIEKLRKMGYQVTPAGT